MSYRLGTMSWTQTTNSRAFRQILGTFAAVLLIAGCSEYEFDSLSPEIEVVPVPVDLGVVPLLGLGTAQVEVRNVGGAPLQIESVTTDSPFATSGMAAELAPDESRAFTISFSSEEAGSFSGTLVIESDDPDRPSLDVPMEAQVRAPALRIEPTALSFPADGDSRTSRIDVSNDGEGVLVISAVLLTDDGGGAFALESTGGASTIETGEAISLDVTCRAAAAASGTLTIVSNDPTSPTFELALDAEPVSCPDLWYPDADNDGHGDRDLPVEACTAPPDHVALGDDCDDDAPQVHPGRTELCNGVDDDCDDTIDFTIPALHFAAFGDAVEIPHAAELALGPSGTMEAWVLSELPNQWGNVYNKWVDGGEDHQLRVGDGAAYGWLVLPSGVDYIHAQSGGMAVPEGDWHHVAFVWEPGEARIYIDGGLAGTGSADAAPANSTGAAFIGSIARPPDSRTPVFGFIADVRLSSSTRYSVDFVPSSDLSVDADTLALWKLDEVTGSLAGEAAAGNDGTVSGATRQDAPCR